MRFLFLFLLFPAASLRGDLASLESLTAEWIRLRTERARESESWLQEQNRLQMELRLLGDAETHLQDELASLRAEESESETQQADLIAELEERQALHSALYPRVSNALTAALDLTEALPLPLQNRLGNERAQAEAPGRDLLPRIRALLSLHHQWLQMQTTLHAESMVIPLAGTRREMDVLWIGTALAYAVNGDNTLAALGSPGPEGWVWTETHALAPRIRQALRIQKQEAPPALIRLPVEVQP